MSLLRGWRINPWVGLLAVCGILLFTRLSWWQWDRGEQKAAIEASRLNASLEPPTEVRTLDPENLPWGARLTLEGQWEPERSLILDNQTADGRPGGHVWTVFRLSSGQSLLVDRGWAALPGDRSLPVVVQPPASAEVRGILRDLPRPGLAGPAQCPQAEMPRLNYPTIADLRCVLGEAILPALLLLDPDVPGAYRRQWQHFEIPPERHYGYAFQWAALALTILVLLLRFGRGSSSGDHQ